MHNETPEISVIICTYNTKDLTCECLDRLKKSIDNCKKVVETIVVEDGTDGTDQLIKNNYPWVKLLEPKENLGFARGNNLAFKAANENSKYYLLLNTDALINPETITKALEFMETNDSCDVLGCRLNFGDGKFQPSGGFLPTPISTLTWIFGIDLLPILKQICKPFHQKEINFFKSDREIGWVMGAFLFAKREVIEKTNGFDEHFFMYTEEVEWCKRIHDLGFKIWYTPRFKITHLDKTSSKNNEDGLRKIYKNEILGVTYYLKKYYSNKLVWVLPLIKFAVWMRAFTFSILGNKARSQAYKETLKEL